MDEERFAVGTVEGTGAAINVICGFKPRYVKIFNYDDAGSKVPYCEWFYGMTAGYGLKHLIGTTYTTPSIITTGGISQYCGTDAQGSGQGFTIGTDGDLNVTAETIFWLAVR